MGSKKPCTLSQTSQGPPLDACSSLGLPFPLPLMLDRVFTSLSHSPHQSALPCLDPAWRCYWEFLEVKLPAVSSLTGLHLTCFLRGMGITRLKCPHHKEDVPGCPDCSHGSQPHCLALLSSKPLSPSEMIFADLLAPCLPAPLER